MKKLLFFISLLAFVAIAFVSSCNKTALNSGSNDHFSEFLDVEFTDIPSLTESDWKIITEAACRMRFYVEGGEMKSCINSASEINVSQRLFLILQEVIKSTNSAKVFCLPDYTTKNGEDPTYDCVAVSLAQLGDYSYSVIQKWIVEQYGDNGVPVKELNKTVHNFYPNALGFNPNKTLPPDINWDASKTVGVFSVGNGYGHMANIVGKIDSTLIFRDGADTTEYIVPLSEVSYVYYNIPAQDTVMAKISVNALRTTINR